MSALSYEHHRTPTLLPGRERDLLVMTYVQTPDGSSLPLLNRPGFCRGSIV